MNLVTLLDFGRITKWGISLLWSGISCYPYHFYWRFYFVSNQDRHLIFLFINDSKIRRNSVRIWLGGGNILEHMKRSLFFSTLSVLSTPGPVQIPKWSLTELLWLKPPQQSTDMLVKIKKVSIEEPLCFYLQSSE